jgi:hypothetical protein
MQMQQLQTKIVVSILYFQQSTTRTSIILRQKTCTRKEKENEPRTACSANQPAAPRCRLFEAATEITADGGRSLVSIALVKSLPHISLRKQKRERERAAALEFEGRD